MTKADLHVHTDISDGSLDIEGVIKLAKNEGITHLSITNHDTVKGIKEAIEIGKKYGIKVIPGVEMSAYDYKRKRKVHLLAYNFDLEAKNITRLGEDLLMKRNRNGLKQCEIIKELGYNIDLDKIKGYAKNSSVIYKQYIMRELVEKGYTDKMYSSLYKSLFMGDGPCRMDIKYMDVFDAIKAIKADNGIAVVAHPGQKNSYEVIEELVEFGLDGIEKYHPSHKEEDIKKVQELADKYNLITTGGSDFHGEYAKSRKLGCCLCPKESIKFLY